MENNVAQTRLCKVTRGMVNALINNSNIPMKYEHEYSLNTKFNVQKDVPSINKTPINYVIVGNNGCYNINDQNLSAPREINKTNKCLYNIMPIRCVPLDEDLTSEEREPFRMRVIETHHGRQYACYYAMTIPWSDITTTVIDPVSKQPKPYVDDPNGLNPTVPSVSPSGAIITGDKEINIELDGVVRFNASWLREGANVIYGDARYSGISELGLCTGEDKVVSGPAATGTIDYKEAVYMQLSTHMTCERLPFLNPNGHRDFNIKLGADDVVLV